MAHDRNMPPRTASPDPAADAPDLDATPAADATQPGVPAEHGFFTWLRRLDLPRRPGWIGGVCSGVAARIGVDPVLVRGIVVVVAVLGGPVALLYALAWFLLPDEQGTIHARELGHGRVTRAIPGIVGVFLLSFLPLAQGFWFSGAFYWSDLGAGGVALRVVWTGALVASAVVLVVWLARRSARASDITTSPATTDDRPETVPSAPAAAAAEKATVSAPGEPTPPPADASGEELAAWKRGQDDWQRQRAQWAAEQRRSEREQRAADARARNEAALAAARERTRVDRFTRPRVHGGVVALVLGLALVAAAIAAALAQAQPATRGAHWVIGAATLLLVLGVGIVVVGLARRRSAGLTSLSITAVFLLTVSVGLLVVPIDREILPFTGGYDLPRDHDGRYLALAGSTELRVLDRPDGGEIPVVDLWQVSGNVDVWLEQSAAARIEVVTDGRDWQIPVVENFGSDRGQTSSFLIRDGQRTFTVGGGVVDVVFRVHLGDGAYMAVWGPSPGDTPLTFDPVPDSVETWGDAPAPTSSPTEGVTP